MLASNQITVAVHDLDVHDLRHDQPRQQYIHLVVNRLAIRSNRASCVGGGDAG